MTCGKLFSTLFGVSYHTMMIAGAIFVLVYTFIGGFLAESASDFMQAVVMVIALLTILILGTSAAGGLGQVIENAAQIPGYFSLTSTLDRVLTRWECSRRRLERPCSAKPEITAS